MAENLGSPCSNSKKQLTTIEIARISQRYAQERAMRVSKSVWDIVAINSGYVFEEMKPFVLDLATAYGRYDI
jgi:hypothetical protein